MIRTLPRIPLPTIGIIVLILLVLAIVPPVRAATGTRTFTTVQDFSVCESHLQPTLTQVAVSAEADGEIGLLPKIGDDFAGTLIDPAYWTTGVYTSSINPSGSPPDVTVANGIVSVHSSNQSNLDGSYLRGSQVQSYGVTEGEITFSKGWYQHFGLAPPGFEDDFRFALFSTGEDKPGIYDSDTLYARVNNSDTEIKIPLGPIPTSAVRLRIEWTNVGGADLIRFYSEYNGTTYTRMDEISLASYIDPNKTFVQPLYVHLSNKSTDAQNQNQDPGPAWNLSANWIRILPYTAPSGSYTSCPIYAALNERQTWGPISFTKLATPPGGALTVEVRTSDDAINWSAFTPITSGATPSSPPGIYIQYRVTITRGTNPADSPRLTSISLGYTSQSVLAPHVAPSSGPMGTHFLFVGNGFTANTTLTVALDSKVLGTLPATSAGGFAFYIDSSNFNLGTHTATISGAGHTTISLPFSVTTGKPGPPAPGGTLTFQPKVRLHLPLMRR